MVNHPLEGKLEASIRCMDMAARVKLYGTDPVFIFDPNNKTNRPVKGIHDNCNHLLAVISGKTATDVYQSIYNRTE